VKFLFVFLLFAATTSIAIAENFPTGTFSPRPGPHRAPLGQVELTKKGENYFLRFQMAKQMGEGARSANEDI
jgi:hypothetical protein